MINDALPTAARCFCKEAAAKGDSLDSETEGYLDALESGPVNICRESVKAMQSSDIRREGLREAICDGNFRGTFKTQDNKILTLPMLELLRDCETRWSSTHNMVKRYLQLYPVSVLLNSLNLHVLMAMNQAVAQYAHQHPEMRIPIALHNQYEVLQDICAIFSILDQAQELLSAEQTPTLALALPVYKALIQTLKDCTFKFPELHHAVTCGILKLESYIEKA